MFDQDGAAMSEREGVEGLRSGEKNERVRVRVRVRGLNSHPMTQSKNVMAHAILDVPFHCAAPALCYCE